MYAPLPCVHHCPVGTAADEVEGVSCRAYATSALVEPACDAECCAVGGIEANPDFPNKGVLQGRLQAVAGFDGIAVFTDLCIMEASAKHEEREFCLLFTPVQIDGILSEQRQLQPQFGSCVSSPFYSYSHVKVLSRRREVINFSLFSTSLFGDVIPRWRTFQGRLPSFLITVIQLSLFVRYDLLHRCH